MNTLKHSSECFFLYLYIYNKTNLNNMPSKIIKLTELDLNTIVSKVLREQEEKIYDKHDKSYDYKVSGGEWLASKKGLNKWFPIKKYIKSINTLDRKYPEARKSEDKTSNGNKTKDKPSISNKTNNQNTFFKDKKEGDEFRKWTNKYYPKLAKKIDLSLTGSYNNSYIKRALNSPIKLRDTGKIVPLGELYASKHLKLSGDSLISQTKQLIDKGMNKIKQDKNKNIFVSDTISPVFRNKIDFNNLSVGGTTNKICKPGSTQCAQFVNDFTDKFDVVGNAWTAYGLDSKLGSTISSKFKGLDKSEQDKVINLWLKIHKNGGGKDNGKYKDEAKKLIGSLVGSGLKTNLKIDDVVGIYHEPSSHHEEAFHEGGQRWFKDINGKKVPGTTIKKGSGWGMNTHVGIVGVEKNGVPLIFHNVNGNVKSDPADNLKIAWVKRKGGTKPVKV